MVPGSRLPRFQPCANFMNTDLNPEISFIIPAWNESRWLPRTLAAVHRVTAELDTTWELIVVDNASTDDTADLARQTGAKVVTEPIRQISRARNAGAAVANGRLLIFLDADTLLSAELLRTTRDLLLSGEICAGGARVEFDQLNHVIYRRGTELWNQASRYLGLAAGCYLFCTREAFEAVGGFSEQLYAGEEVFLSRCLTRWGRRHGQRFQIISDPPVITSGRKADWYSPWQHLVVIALVLLFPLSLRSRRLSWFWYKRPDG